MQYHAIMILISLSVDARLPLTVLSIKVGVLLKDKNLDFLINNLIILCKHFIDRCKFLKVKPHFSGRKNEQDICEVSSLHAAQKHKETLKCFELVFVVRIIRPFFFLFYSAIIKNCAKINQPKVVCWVKMV